MVVSIIPILQRILRVILVVLRGDLAVCPNSERGAILETSATVRRKSPAREAD